MSRPIFNIRLWEPFLRNRFIQQTDLLFDSIRNRLIPTFSDLEREAEQLIQDKWGKLCSLCCSPDIDPADLAEKAQEAGIEYYIMLLNIKQGLLNLSAVAFYHLFEQQIIFFLRTEILHPSQKDNHKLARFSVFKEKALERGLDIRSLKSWRIINELKLVANTIKHAEGRSSAKLLQIRPDLFKRPNARTENEQDPSEWGSSRVYLPLAGEDVFVTLDDLLKYKDAIICFWDEFINICLNHE